MAALAFRRRPAVWLGWLIGLAYVIYAAAQLDLSWPRFLLGLDNGAKFLDRMFPPVIIQPDTMAKGLLESLEIALLASVNSLPIKPIEATVRVRMPAMAPKPTALTNTMATITG